MPLTFSIGREDVLRSKTVKPGWYKCHIRNITQEPASTDGSINTLVDLVILEGEFKDVPLTGRFNEKAPGFAVNFIKALGGNVTEQGFSGDLTSGIGKDLFVYVKNDMYQNRLTNKVEDYRGLGDSIPAASGGAKK